MTEAEIGDGLRAWAEGNRGLEAAVKLLIVHRAWITRASSPPQIAGTGPWEGSKLFYRPIDQPRFEVIDWAVARLHSRDESAEGTMEDRRILAIAVRLAGKDVVDGALGRDATTSLRLLIVGPSDENRAIVSEAFQYAFSVDD